VCVSFSDDSKEKTKHTQETKRWVFEGFFKNKNKTIPPPSLSPSLYPISVSDGCCSLRAQTQPDLFLWKRVSSDHSLSGK
jgi:hypothetical protein